MTTFYRDATIRVTSSLVEINGREYPLGELADVRHDGWFRAVRAWAYWFGRGLALLGLVALIPGFVVAIVIAVRLTNTDGWGLIERIGVALGLWGGLATFCWRVGLEGYFDELGTREIRARWRGEEVVLLRMTRLVAFVAIYWALQRALSSST